MNFLKKAFEDVGPKFQELKEKTKSKYVDLKTQIIQKQEQLLNSQSQQEQKMEDVQIKKKNSSVQIIEIDQRIYWMGFPNKDLMVKLSQVLEEKFGNNYYIWNVSEHQYPTFWFKEQVYEHTYSGYPNPSLIEIFLICKSIIQWLYSDNNNIAIIHCQQTRGRSALIISCLLTLLQKFNHPGEALTFFCRKTRTRDSKILFACQELYLNYFAKIMAGIKLNTKTMKLTKIIISDVPQIQRNDEKGRQIDNFRPYLQIFKESKIIYNSLTQQKLSSFVQSDITIWFEIDNLEIKEDILIRVKHYQDEQVRFPICRMMINTNFVHDNVLRLLKKDIDFTPNISVPDNMYIDLIFAQTENQNQLNQTGQNQQKKANEIQDLLYVVQDCQRLLKNNTSNNKIIISQDKQKLKEMQIQEQQNQIHEQQKQLNQQFAEQNFEIIDSEDSDKERKESDDLSQPEKENSTSNEDEQIKNESQKEKEVVNEEEQEKEHEIKINKLLGELDEELSGEEDIDDYINNLEKDDD